MPDRGRWTYGESGEFKRVLLVHPPLDRLRGLEDRSFPIHAGYIAEALQADDMHSRVFNAEMPEEGERLKPTSERGRFEEFETYAKAVRNRDHQAWVKLDQTIQAFDPNMIVFWLDTARCGAALAASMIARGATEARIAWCGPYPTAVPAAVLNPNVDFVVRGEAEKIVVSLARALRHGEPIEKVRGIAYAQTGKVVNTKQHELVRDVDTLMPPGRHLDLNKKDYPPEELAVLYSSRGAPVVSRHTSHHVAWGRVHRRRSNYGIMEELRRVIDHYSPPSFRFCDPCFTANAGRALALCKAIGQAQLQIPWSCNSRADTVDPRLLEAMARAGCELVRFDVTTGSPELLERLGIDSSIEQVEQVGDICQSLGIAWAADFATGFPYETEDQMLETLELMTELDADLITLRVITPEPGTALFSDAVKMELIPKQIDWSAFSQYNPKLNFVKNVSRERFDELVEEMLTFTEHHNKSLTKHLTRGLKKRLRLVTDRFRKLRG